MIVHCLALEVGVQRGTLGLELMDKILEQKGNLKVFLISCV